jgi:hypothetical protein
MYEACRDPSRNIGQNASTLQQPSATKFGEHATAAALREFTRSEITEGETSRWVSNPGHETVVVMHNDAVVQSLSEVPNVEREGPDSRAGAVLAFFGVLAWRSGNA